ncbi:MAG: hypothetical protein JSR17_10565 [Proteobacteria bacterium]|nr:hypothetical protein [Pseudomonadota bacterium]
MTLSIKETALLKKALASFHKTTSLSFIIESSTMKESTYSPEVDCMLRLKSNKEGKLFVGEIKLNLTKAALGAAISHLKQLSHQGILITDYVNPNSAELLREMDIPFFDTVGNAYIKLNNPSLFIYVKGNKPPQLPSNSAAFTTAGIKVIFYFLCCPEKVNASYREIATSANVALGRIGTIINDLKEMGYLLDKGSLGRKLINIESLIEKWVDGFEEKLRKKLILGRFKTDEFNWWKDAKMPKNSYWGAEVAAANMTNYLKPEIITIYTDNNINKLKLIHELKSEPNGNIEVLKTFWNFTQKSQELNLVPPLLTYADLIISGDPRNIETAKIIYEKNILKHLK